MQPTTEKPMRHTRDLLALARSVHQKVSDHYRQQGSRLEDVEARMLLDYIRRKEQTLQTMVDQYRQQAPDRILDTYYQFTPAQIRTVDEFLDWEPAPDADANEILSTARRVDSFMESFYHRAAQMAENEDIREVLENLAQAVVAKEKDETLNADFMEDI
jgi:rubrerythrin